MTFIKGSFGRLVILIFSIGLTFRVGAQCPVDPLFTIDQFCDSVVFQNTSIVSNGEIEKVIWDFGDGNTLTDDIPPYDDPIKHIYASGASYDVIMEVYLDFSGGCMESIQQTVHVYYPTSSFQVVAGCVNDTTFLINNSTSTSDSIISWFWDFGDGNFSADTNPVHVYTSNDYFDIKLAVANTYGCTDTLTKTKLIESPVAGFTFDTVCLGLATHFYDTSTYIQNQIVSRLWYFDDNNTSTLVNPTFTFETAGIHSVSLVVTNGEGCSDSIQQNVQVGAVPVANFSFDAGCKNDTTFLFDLSTPNANSIDFWEWDFGDGSPFAHFPDTAHVYTDDGVYNIKLTVINNLGCSDDTTRAYLISTPKAGFISDSTCLGNSISFIDTSSSNILPITSWFWDFGDNNTATTQNATYTYAEPELYDVMHIVANTMGCADTAYSTALIDSVPYADFSFTPGCEGAQTCFFDESDPNSSSITDWYWDFGDGSISTLQNPCHTFSDTGSYVVSFIVVNSNGCYSDLKVDTVTVAKPPLAAFSANTICFGDTTYFINQTDSQNVSIANWRWTFGDTASLSSDTSWLFESYHLYTNPGSYIVKLYVENISGCTDSILHVIEVDSIPEAAFIIPDTIAVDKLFTIYDESLPHGSPILNRYWDFGDGQTANNINPVLHSYDSPGFYEICLAVEDVNGCYDYFCDSIKISAPPSADFQWASDVTFKTYFYDESLPANTVVSWHWDFGDPTTQADTAWGTPSPVYTYPEEGFYEACLHIVDRFGGVHDTCKTVYAGNAVIADFDNFGVCLGDTTYFLDNSYSPISAGFEAWFWDFGDGNTMIYPQKKDTISHKYLGPGSYQVKFGLSATINGFFMSDTMYKTIRIFEHPEAHVDSSDLGVCFGNPIHFKDLTQSTNSFDTITKWIWDFDSRGDSAFIKNPVHNYPDTGTFNVKMKIITEHGCTSIDSVRAHVNFSPKFPFKWKNPCINSPTLFIPDYDSSKIKITSWFWNFGDNLDTSNTSTDPKPTHIFDRVANYRVTMEMDAYNCPGDTSFTILIMPIPYSDFNFQTDYDGVQGRTKFVNNSVYATSYLWDFGNGNTSTVPDPIEVYELDSVYTVTLTSTNEYTCSDTSRFEINVFFKGLYFPTAFSPNNPNELISEFTPKGVNLEEYSVQVFDLKGNLMWESDRLDGNGTPVESWDGYYNDILMPQGMYVWKAYGLFRDGTVWKGQDFSNAANPKTNGVVTLIR